VSRTFFGSGGIWKEHSVCLRRIRCMMGAQCNDMGAVFVFYAHSLTPHLAARLKSGTGQLFSDCLNKLFVINSFDHITGSTKPKTFSHILLLLGCS